MRMCRIEFPKVARNSKLLAGADLRGADLRGANLTGAYLRDAYLRGADLRGTYLTGANLRDADLDFSTWPLHCGSFGAKADDRLLLQLCAHVARLNPKYLTSRGKKLFNEITEIEDFKNWFCEFRNDIVKM